ncbi:porin family protein [Catalinimonas sp. 4WD22]|uniref:porin family protein n=1 Tax=Catalinimonas locisalis TaxID=3133978 RepID=UPI0031014264
MKKLIFSFALLVFLSSAATAQVKFGLKAGAMWSNIATIAPDSLSGLGPEKLSYLVGGFMNIPINAKFSVQPELLYANKGWKNFYRHYINLPLMLQYKITDRLKIEAGPEVGYLLGATSGSMFSNFYNRTHNYTSDFDLAINIGASYDLTDRLNIGLRYNHGVLDSYKFETSRFSFSDTNLADFFSDYNIQNRTLQLSVGWKLGK